MYCTKCGQQNVDSASFCLSCGNVLNAPVEETNNHAPPTARPSGYSTQPPPPMAVPTYASEYMPKQQKPYRAEYSLGLVGSIIGSVIFLFLAIASFVELSGGLSSYSYYNNNYVEGLVFVTTVLCLASIILGYMGISKINKLILDGGYYL